MTRRAFFLGLYSGGLLCLLALLTGCGGASPTAPRVCRLVTITPERTVTTLVCTGSICVPYVEVIPAVTKEVCE